MTENISDKELHVRHLVYGIMNKHEERAFEELDHLHRRDIHDNEVIKALRDGGYRSEADAYIEWAHCIDPDVDPTPDGPELVTDPGDSPSYANHPLNKLSMPEGVINIDGTVGGLESALALFRDKACEVEVATGAEQVSDLSYAHYTNGKVTLG